MPEETSQIELIPKAPPYLYEGCFKLVMGQEYCFRKACTCPWQAQCKYEKVPVDVSQEPNIRRAFVARPGFWFADIDYSGVELRLAANLSLEPVWVNAFRNGLDLHAETAKVIFGKEFTKVQRQMAKCVRRGSKVKFRMVSATEAPGASKALFETVRVQTAEGSIPLIFDSGVLVINPLGHLEKKLARDLKVNDYLIEHPFPARPMNFKRSNMTLGVGKTYLLKGLSIHQIKTVRSKNYDGLLVLGLERTEEELFTVEVTQDIDFAHTDEHQTGDFIPLHNVQAWTRNGWKTAAFLYFDGVQDFWTLKVGDQKLQGTNKHLVWVRRGDVEDWIELQNLNPDTDLVLIEEKNAFLWKSFRILCPEKLTIKRIRQTEEENRPYRTRDQMFDLVVPDGHELVVGGFVSHNTSNFSNLYGGTPQSLAASANIPLDQARDIWERWWRGLPKLKDWYDQVCIAAKAAGCVKTAFGRRRSLKEWYDGDKRDKSFADRSAVNTIIQGSSADIMKMALALIHKQILDRHLQDELRILLTIHDEILFEILKEKVVEHLLWIIPIMSRTPKNWPVQLKVECELGHSWGTVGEIELPSALRDYFEKGETPAPAIVPTQVVLPEKKLVEAGVMPVVIEIGKSHWLRSKLTRLRQAIQACPGSSPLTLQVGGEILSGEKLPKVDGVRLSLEWERIKSGSQ